MPAPIETVPEIDQKALLAILAALDINKIFSARTHSTFVERQIGTILEGRVTLRVDFTPDPKKSDNPLPV